MNRVIQIGSATNKTAWDNPSCNRVYDKMGISPTLNTCGGGGLQPLVVIEKQIKEIGNIANSKVWESPMAYRVYDPEGISPTLIANPAGGARQPITINKENNMEYRIRKLTPRECWRLMDFPDWAFDKAKDAGVSNGQLYKQAGNSICVGVLEKIFENLYKAMPYLFDDLKVCSCFSGIGAFEMALNRMFNKKKEDSINEDD